MDNCLWTLTVTRSEQFLSGDVTMVTCYVKTKTSNLFTNDLVFVRYSLIGASLVQQ